MRTNSLGTGPLAADRQSAPRTQSTYEVEASVPVCAPKGSANEQCARARPRACVCTPRLCFVAQMLFCLSTFTGAFLAGWYGSRNAS